MLAISSPRLAARIEALARFGALPGGGVTRPCWSPEHEAARAWLVAEMRAAGLTTWVDPAGNVFGALGASAIRADAPVVLTGSHIDTVPEGGILDGALGVLAGLEALQAIREGGGAHCHPLAVAAWSDEEGRYGSLFGSRAFTGRLDVARIPEMAAVDGERLSDAMARAGFDAARAPEAKAPRGAVAAYIELRSTSSRGRGSRRPGFPSASWIRSSASGARASPSSVRPTTRARRPCRDAATPSSPPPTTPSRRGG